MGDGNIEGRKERGENSETKMWEESLAYRHLRRRGKTGFYIKLKGQGSIWVEDIVKIKETSLTMELGSPEGGALTQDPLP